MGCYVTRGHTDTVGIRCLMLVAGFVVPVLSNNIHEARAFNRMASIARGRVLIIIQVCHVPCVCGGTCAQSCQTCKRVLQHCSRPGACMPSM